MEDKNYKIAILGAEEAIMGFIPLGVSCFPIKEESEAEQVIEILKSEQFAVVFITEDWASRIRHQLDEAEGVFSR